MARLDFANRHNEWTSDDWKRIILTDETKINRWGSDGGRRWCWKEPGTARRLYQVKQTVKHGGDNLMAWGAFMANGVGGLALIENRMNAALYCKVLLEDWKHSLRDIGANVEEAICQDIDPKHL